MTKLSRLETQPIVPQHLEALGLERGDLVMVHTSLRRLGLGREGAPALFRALAGWHGLRQDGDGPDEGGGVLVPSFAWSTEDPAGWVGPYRLPPHEFAERQARVRPYDPATSAVESEIGFFPEYFARRPGVVRGPHPSLAFAGLGQAAVDAVMAQPLHLPFGPDSPLGWLYETDGKVLMAGTDLTSLTLLHLAETITPRSYVRAASRRVLAAAGWVWYHGAPNCGKGFARAAEVWEPAICGRGRLGAASAITVKARTLIDLVLPRLAADPSWLLCGEGTCPFCAPAWLWLRGEIDHMWYGDPACIPR